MVEWSCYHDPLRLRLCFDDLSPRETTPSLVKGSPAVFFSPSLHVCVVFSSPHASPSRDAFGLLAEHSAYLPAGERAGRREPAKAPRDGAFLRPRKCSLFCVSCVSLFSSVSSPCSPLLALALKCPPPCSLIPVSSVFPFPVVPRRSPSSLGYPWPRVFCLPFPRR